MKTNLRSTIGLHVLLILAAHSLALAAEPVIYHDQVLLSDTTWSGDILIDGVVVVNRGVTLRIAPGAIVRFKRVDRNHDDIGDAEIRVLGRLLAEGTKNQRIRFTSAEETPQCLDWSYLLLFASGQENHVRYCEFQYAFSGLQVHFSTAFVSDSLFEHNYEGIRFGRARLVVEHSTFRNNDTGIRFTRMEGPVEIRNNEITQNRQGIFLVPSGQNIQDFFSPERADRPWNTGRLSIVANNVYDNTWYNLKLGEKQLWDLAATKNWWGTTDNDLVAEKMFDKLRDPSLGQVVYQPIAITKIERAGVQ